MKIKQLSEDLANKIAAGEVVERPANVVKELVENSIDASSHRIRIFIEEGGMKKILVEDDGSGMSQEDALMCFFRHATSKISNEQDLFTIRSLGFRGEAIPSIASVSHFILKTSEGKDGYEVVYEFGKCLSQQTCAFHQGTSICVEKLFYNLPARLKYLKSVQSEFAAIQNLVERLALGHPTIAFELYHDGRLIFKTSGHGQLLEVISAIYGLATAKNMIPVDVENEDYHIHGYISKIDTSRASKQHMITLVNQRVVRVPLAQEAILDVYKYYLLDRRYPIVVLYIDVDPYLVDVNVHPSKLEVKFSKEDTLRTLLSTGVQAALNQVNLVYQAKNKPTEKEKKAIEQPHFQFQYTSSSDVLPVSPEVKEEEPVYQDKEVKKVIEAKKEHIVESNIDEVIEEKRVMAKHLLVKGQARGTYIIAEDDEGMYLIDQHAAKERINYEYFKAQFQTLDMRMQDLIVPLTFNYTLSEATLIKEKKSFLETTGIFLEEFGPSTFVVKTLPLWTQRVDPMIFIEEMIDHLLHTSQVDVVALQEHAIATLSCKASVKANTYLDHLGMQKLVDDLMCCENPYVCPHGRPVLIFYSDYELEKLFKRVV